MDIDLSTPVAGALGLTVQQLGTYLLMAVFIAPIISAARPHVEPVLVRWREGAALTRTTADDHAVRFASLVWSALLLVPLVPLKLFPIFKAAIEAAESARKGPSKRTGAALGLVLTLVLLAGALVSTSGCAAGAPAVHQGLNAATDLVDPAYQTAVIECDMQEGEIIANYPPEEVDAADVALAALRVRCDVAFASFQGVRAAQLLVRATLDAKEDGRATTQDVLRSLDELREAQATARQFVDAIRAARRGAP